MSKIPELRTKLPGLPEKSTRCVLPSVEVAVLRHATRALLLHPEWLEEMHKHLPEDHRRSFRRALEVVSARWWYRASQVGLPEAYTDTTRDENQLIFPLGHPKRVEYRPYRPRGRPKGSKDKNRTPGKQRGRPRDPRSWRSRLPYPSFKDAMAARDWCQAARIPSLPSVKRALGIQIGELEGREELFCIENKIPWHEYVHLRRDVWTPQDPKTIHETPRIPRLAAPLSELLAKVPSPTKSLRSEICESDTDDEDIKKRLLGD